MKVCPKCGSVSADDQQKFCLMDGREMVAADSEPTVVIPPGSTMPTVTAVAAKRKRSPFVWVALALLILVVGGSLLVGLLIYSYRLGNESAKNDKPANANLAARTTSTPGRSAPQSTPTVAAADTETSPPPAPSPGSSNADSDEATPITWTTAASSFKEDTGRTYKFLCPPEGMSAIIWGVDVYTADSSICTAAVHAGIITLEKGGEVTIEFRPGRQVYGGTTRNGITSSTYGEYPHSFVVR